VNWNTLFNAEPAENAEKRTYINNISALNRKETSMYKLILFLITSFILFSCSSSPPRQDLQMDVEMPDEWHSEQAILHDSLNVSINWWTEFSDTTLNGMIEEAYVRNLNLVMAAASLEAAGAQAIIAGASFYPKADLSVDGTRRKQNFIGMPFPGAGGDDVLSSTSTAYGVSLNISWELDLWGRIRAEESAAVAQFQAAQADYIAANLSIAGQVSKAFFAVITARKQLELSLATHDSWKLSTNQVHQRYISGLSSALEYRLSLSNLSRANASLSANRIQLDVAKRQLELLLKRFPSATIKTVNDLPEVLTEVPSGMPAEILSRRPDLVSAERKLASAEMSLKSAERSLYPRISLTGSGGTTTADLKNLINGDFGVWSLAGNLVQPLFQGGKLRANVDFNQAQTKMALAEYEATLLNALAEVENALTKEYYLSQREEALKEATDQSSAARRLAEIQYSRGVTDFLTMLESARAAYDTESLYLNARRERLDARVDLYLALGGGFDLEKSIIEIEDEEKRNDKHKVLKEDSEHSEDN
jgi:multidrug efflux system outer membrane protein